MDVNSLLFDSSVGAASILKSKVEIPMRRSRAGWFSKAGQGNNDRKAWLTLATRFP